MAEQRIATRTDASAAQERRGALADISVRCPLCGADDYRVRFESSLGGDDRPAAPLHVDVARVRRWTGAIVECRSCGLVYMNPRPHHQKVQDAYGAVEDVRYVEEEDGPRRDVLREPPARAALRAAAAGCSTSAATSARSSSWPSRRASRSRASSRRAGRPIARTRACAGTSSAAPSRMPRSRPTRTTPSRSGTSSSTCPIPASDLRAIWHALRPGGVVAISTMDVDALFPRARRTALALVHADAPRLLLAPHAAPRCCAARASRSPTCARTGARCASPTSCRASAPTAVPAHRAAAALTRASRLAERIVGVNLGDIFTVVARKPRA